MKIREYWERFELYVLSLWFLFLIIAVFAADIPVCLSDNCNFVSVAELTRRNTTSIVALCFLAFGAVFYTRFKYRVRRAGSMPVKIVAIEDVNYEHLTFLATYILPLVSLDLSSNRSLALIVVLLLLMGLVYVKTNLFYANPTLALLGFNLFRVTTKDSSGELPNQILISRDRLSLDQRIQRVSLGGGVFYARSVE